MTAADTETAVVLGVGPEGHLASGTIAFAVEAATRLGLGVEVVHVVPSLVGGLSGTWETGITLDDLAAEGQRGLDAAVAAVRARMGDAQPVTGTLVRGPGVVATFVERSRQAELVVLERHHVTRLHQIMEDSVVAGVAARAHTPVVAVPADWTPSHLPRPITVGVEDAARAAAELWTALGLAAATDVPVRAVRATYLPEAFQEILRRQVQEQEFLSAARAELIRDAALPPAVCEKVPCTFEARWGSAADVLVDLSGTSSLLVLARRDPRLPFGSHLGPVVRHVLREATCPVMVVEPTLHAPIDAEQSLATVGA